MFPWVQWAGEEGAHVARCLRTERMLRSLSRFGGSANLALTGYQSILVVSLVRGAHLHAGLVLALTGLGGVTGAFSHNPSPRAWIRPRAACHKDSRRSVRTSDSARLIPITRGLRRPRRHPRRRRHRRRKHHHHHLHTELRAPRPIRTDRRDQQRHQLRHHANRRPPRRRTRRHPRARIITTARSRASESWQPRRRVDVGGARRLATVPELPTADCDVRRRAPGAARVCSSSRSSFWSASPLTEPARLGLGSASTSRRGFP